MAKKKKGHPSEMLSDFDPNVEKLALERLLSGKQLFDYRSHRLQRHIRDQGQARAVLLRAEALAGQLGKKLVLRYLERRLLNQIYEELQN